MTTPSGMDIRIALLATLDPQAMRLYRQRVRHAYENFYVPEGKAVHLVICSLCRDAGRYLTDDGTEGEFCDCRSGMAQYENTEYEAGSFPAWSNGWWDL